LISGAVSSSLVPLVTITLIGPNGSAFRVPAGIDTGFTGYVSAPLPLIESLRTSLVRFDEATLANGRVIEVPAHPARIRWGQAERRVSVMGMGDWALLGMAILADHRLSIDITDGGQVLIEPLHSSKSNRPAVGREIDATECSVKAA